MSCLRALTHLAHLLVLGCLATALGGCNGGGDEPAETAAAQCIASVSPGTPGVMESYGDGAGPGSAGDGAGDAGPGLGRFLNAIVRVEQADGTFGGEAVVDDTRGVVRFVLCGYDGPVRVTVRGQDDGSTRYFDESARTYVAYPPGATMNAVVPRFEKNIGITVLTEAAWQYLLARYGADGWKSADRVAEANAVVRNEFNRLLPAGMQIEDITRLPELLSETTVAGSVPNTGNGTYGVVTSGLARAAGLLRAGDVTAALALAAQIGADLCDGLIDGKCNGASVVGDSAELAYLPPQLGEFLNAGVGDIAAGCGNAEVESGTLRITQLRLEAQYPNEADPVVGELTPMFLLRNDGRVFFWATRSAAVVPYAEELRFRQLFTSGPVLGVTTDGRAIRARLEGDPSSIPPAAATVLAPQGVSAYDGVTTVAEVPALPAGPFGLLVRAADGTALVERSRYLGPRQPWVPELESSGLRDVVRVGVASGGAAGVGYFALTASGNLFAWGSNAGGMLGLGQTALELPSQPTPALVRFPAGVFLASVAGRPEGGFAIDASGSVWEWGQAGRFEAVHPVTSTRPARVAAFEPFGAIRQIECAAERACAALTDRGDFLVWGYASTGSTSLPVVWPIGINRVATPAGRRAVYVGSSGLVVYALLDDGSLALVTTTPASPQISNPFLLVARSSDGLCTTPPPVEEARPRPRAASANR
jgi:hypothetical protein